MASTLTRYTTLLDPSIPIPALLYNDEQLLASQDNVGLYDGPTKSPPHQTGAIHVSSHRLFYASDDTGLSMDLSHVARTDHFAGLFTSSPKITLFLHPLSSVASDDPWECPICSYKNPSGLSPSARSTCSLCGSTRPSTLQIACKACTFLNDSSATNCQICETPLLGASRLDESGLDEERYIKLSFRSRGDMPFYATLKRALFGKAWEASIPTSVPSLDNSLGIGRVLQQITLSDNTTSNSMTTAFNDLERFMANASKMVSLAEDLNSKLQRNPGVLEPEESKFIRSSLTQLGLTLKNAPVIQEDSKDEEELHQKLADELSSVLQDPQKGIMSSAGSGIVALDQVWGAWNRARGVALLPPTTLLKTLPYLPLHSNPPINIRTLASGLMVLHTPAFEQTVFRDRLLSRLEDPSSTDGYTLAMVAQIDLLSVPLAKEMIEAVESEGYIWRDDQRSQVRWYKSPLKGYVWDGQL